MATAASQALKISQADQSELSHLADLLHLFHHRNKNQHRHSIWYRHFSLFRKQISSLVSEITSLNTVPTTNLARAQKKKQDAKIISNHATRMDFWRDVMVPKWQHSFSQLIADRMFNVLGVVLMAVLGQVCNIVGITAELEELGQVEVEKVLLAFGREEFGEMEDVGVGVERKVEDEGKVVKRDEGVDVAAAKVEKETATPKETRTKPSSKKRASDESEKKVKKKRKKTGNAIDDIFG